MYFMNHSHYIARVNDWSMSERMAEAPHLAIMQLADDTRLHREHHAFRSRRREWEVAMENPGVGEYWVAYQRGEDEALLLPTAAVIARPWRGDDELAFTEPRVVQHRAIRDISRRVLHHSMRDILGLDVLAGNSVQTSGIDQLMGLRGFGEPFDRTRELRSAINSHDVELATLMQDHGFRARGLGMIAGRLHTLMARPPID